MRVLSRVIALLQSNGIQFPLAERFMPVPTNLRKDPKSVLEIFLIVSRFLMVALAGFSSQTGLTSRLSPNRLGSRGLQLRHLRALIAS